MSSDFLLLALSFVVVTIDSRLPKFADDVCPDHDPNTVIVQQSVCFRCEEINSMTVDLKCEICISYTFQPLHFQ